VHLREALELGRVIEGPAVIEQMDTTIVIAPDFAAEVDQFSNIVLTPRAQA
jgi:N-methylhydantoinase A